jgi:hypothetical protein
VTAAQIALLAGLFAAPAALLRLGSRLRRRGAAARGAFWGGVAGHTLGMAAALWAMMLPPVVWTGGSAWREAAVFGSLAAGALLGAAIGAAAGARRDG